MAGVQTTVHHISAQIPFQREAEMLDGMDTKKLVRKLFEYRLRGGPRTYRIESMFRAYMLSFLLNLPSLSELWRRLDNDPRLRLLCGFTKLPNLSTFSRFVTRLKQHKELVDEVTASLINRFKIKHPDLGEKVAVDSTSVKTNTRPPKVRKLVPQCSDPEADWGIVTSKTTKSGTDWFFGYKFQLLVDAKYQLPLTGFLQSANKNDSPALPKLLEQAESQYDWFKPKAVTADMGYDSEKNHKTVLDRGGAFICPIRSKLKGKKNLYGVFNKHGVPTCMGSKLMEYQSTHPDKGHLYKCQPGGCKLKARKGVVHCKDEYWVDWRTEPDKRLHGPVRRDSLEWKLLYKQRQSVERVFKSMKESRRLNGHYLRGLEKIALHASMSVLAYTATVLNNLQAGVADSHWMVKRVA